MKPTLDAAATTESLLNSRKYVIELIQQKYDQYMHEIQPYCDQILEIEAKLNAINSLLPGSKSWLGDGPTFE